MEQFDIRLVAAAVAVLFAGLTKGVTGMGLPVIATPVLAALYDLPTALAVIVPPTVLSDLPLLWAFRRERGQTPRILPLMVAGALGVIPGTLILVNVDPGTLAGVLGVVILVFVIISWFRFLPRLGDRMARRWAPGVGLVAGLMQGATGSSAPVVTVFFFQLNLSKAAFLFLTNLYFLIVDTSQLANLLWQGVYTSRLALLSAAASCLAMPVLLLALRMQHRISDVLFRKAVLAVLAVTGTVLVARWVL